MLAAVRVQEDREGLPVEALDPVHWLESTVQSGALDHHLDRGGAGQGGVVRGRIEQGGDLLVDRPELVQESGLIGGNRLGRLQPCRDVVVKRPSREELGQLVDRRPVAFHQMIDHFVHRPGGRGGPALNPFDRHTFGDRLDPGVGRRYPRTDGIKGCLRAALAHVFERPLLLRKY